VQFFGIDMRGCCNTRQAYLEDPLLPSNVSATWQMGDGAYVVGTFTASDVTQTIIERLPGTPQGQNVNAGMATAVVVRLAPPEPPTVSIVRNSNGSVTISWDKTAAGAHLYSSTNAAGPFTTDLGTSGSVTIQPTGTQQFYRAALP
jgi:hypothetical protein